MKSTWIIAAVFTTFTVVVHIAGEQTSPRTHETDSEAVHLYLLMVPESKIEALRRRLPRQEEGVGAIGAIGEAAGPAGNVGQILAGVLGGDLRPIFAGSIAFIPEGDFREGVTEVLQQAVAPAIQRILTEFNMNVQRHFNTTTPRPNSQQQNNMQNQNQGNLNQNQGNINPNQGNVNPNQGNFNPNQGNFNQNQGNFNQNQGNFNPNQGNYNHNQGNYNQNQGSFNPNQGNFNQNQGNYNQNQGNYNHNNPSQQNNFHPNLQNEDTGKYNQNNLNQQNLLHPSYQNQNGAPSHLNQIQPNYNTYNQNPNFGSVGGGGVSGGGAYNNNFNQQNTIEREPNYQNNNGRQPNLSNSNQYQPQFINNNNKFTNQFPSSQATHMIGRPQVGNSGNRNQIQNSNVSPSQVPTRRRPISHPQVLEEQQFHPPTHNIPLPASQIA